jgi:drug/metabolite transporter (DMT)-like permease
MSSHTLSASPDSHRLQGLACALAGAIAFSGKAIVAKLMYRLGADAYAVVGMRMAMALPLFMLMAWWSGRATHSTAQDTHLSRRQWWQIAGLGFSGYYLASTLDFLGLQYISASLERAILYLNPTVVLFLSALFLGHRLRLSQLLAMLVSYLGVAVVWLHDWDVSSVVSSSAAGMDPVHAITLGSLLVFFSAVSYAIYLMGSGQVVQRIGSSRLVGWASCAACIMCLVQWIVVYRVSGGQLGHVSALPWLAWALSALNATACTVLPVWLVMRGVQLLGASVAAQVGMVGPLSTIWMAAAWLGEPVGWRLLAGTAAVLAGVVILSKLPKPAPADSAQAKA